MRRCCLLIDMCQFSAHWLRKKQSYILLTGNPLFTCRRYHCWLQSRCKALWNTYRRDTFKTNWHNVDPQTVWLVFNYIVHVQKFLSEKLVWKWICLNLYEKNLVEHTCCHCGEIREMVTFHINLYCPEVYHSILDFITTVTFLHTYHHFRVFVNIEPHVSTGHSYHQVQKDRA
jgi:hypothetical protein